jgi:hypothetical protein
VVKLCEAHRLAIDAAGQERILGFLGGQPYLTRLVLHQVAKLAAEGTRVPAALEQVLSEGATDAGVLADHLRRKLVSVLPPRLPRPGAPSHPGQAPAAPWGAEVDLVPTLRQLLQSPQPVMAPDGVAMRLVGLGLVRRVGNGLVLAADVYRQYLRGKL